MSYELKFREIGAKRQSDITTKQTYEDLISVSDLCYLVILAGEPDYLISTDNAQIAEDLHLAKSLVSHLRGRTISLNGRCDTPTSNIWRLAEIVLKDFIESIFKYLENTIIVDNADTGTIKMAEYLISKVTAILKYEFNLDELVLHTIEYTEEEVKPWAQKHGFDSNSIEFSDKKYSWFEDAVCYDEALNQIIRDKGYETPYSLIRHICELSEFYPPFLPISYTNSKLWSEFIDLLENHVFLPTINKVTSEQSRARVVEELVECSVIYESDVRYIIGELFKDINDIDHVKLLEIIAKIKGREDNPMPLMQYEHVMGIILDIANASGYSGILIDYGYRIYEEFIDSVIAAGVITEKDIEHLESIPDRKLDTKGFDASYYSPSSLFTK